MTWGMDKQIDLLALTVLNGCPSREKLNTTETLAA